MRNRIFAIAVLAGAAAYVFGTGLTVTSAWLITMAAQHPPVLVLSVAVVMVRFFGIGRSVARYAERVLSHEAVFARLSALRARLYQSVVQRVRSNSRNFGALTKSLVDDVERAQEFELRIKLPYVISIVTGMASLLIAWWIDVSLLLWMLPSFVILLLAIPFITKKYIDPQLHEIENCENDYATSIESYSRSYIEADQYGFSEQLTEALKRESVQISQRERAAASGISILATAITLTIGSTITTIAVNHSIREGALPVKVAMSLFLPLVAYEASLMWFPNLFTAGKLRKSLNNIKNYEVISDDAVNVDVSPDATFSMRNVRAFWNQPFTHPVNADLQRGQILTIHGLSGSGKTTLASALFGFASYTGSISIGGSELSLLDDRSTLVTGSLQKSHIFNTSLRENLKIAQPDAGDDELIAVLRDVELSDISLDEILGTYGRALSGGEEKRLAIARALLSPAPVVILDEPLEHLDDALAKRLAERVINRTREKVLVVITHAPWPKSDITLTLTARIGA